MYVPDRVRVTRPSDAQVVTGFELVTTIRVLSAGLSLHMGERRTSISTIVQHRLDKVGTIYWSIVMYINGRQMCALEGPAQHVPAVSTETVEWCAPAVLRLA